MSNYEYEGRKKDLRPLPLLVTVQYCGKYNSTKKVVCASQSNPSRENKKRLRARACVCPNRTLKAWECRGYSIFYHIILSNTSKKATWTVLLPSSAPELSISSHQSSVVISKFECFRQSQIGNASTTELDMRTDANLVGEKVAMSAHVIGMKHALARSKRHPNQSTHRNQIDKPSPKEQPHQS